jgi:hypothetical protein
MRRATQQAVDRLRSGAAALALCFAPRAGAAPPQAPPLPAPAFPVAALDEPKPRAAGAGRSVDPAPPPAIQSPPQADGSAAARAAPVADPARAAAPRPTSALVADLEACAARSGGWLTIASLGTSGGGRAIPLAVWADPAARDTERGPAVFLGDAALLGDPLAADALVDVVGRLAELGERARSSGAAAPPPLGRRATILVAPLLDPDRRAAQMSEAPLASRTARYERNFPVGWTPESRMPGGGARALSLPEVEAAARLILTHGEVALALTLEPELPIDLGHWLAALDAERAAFGAILAWPPEPGAPGSADGAPLAAGDPGLRLGLPQGPGSMHASWYGLAGTYPASVVPRGGRAPRAEDLLALLEHAATLVPELALEASSIERLDQNHWVVDCRLSNAGALPTRPARARELGGLAPIELELDGAELSGAAAPAPGSTVQERLELRGSGVRLGDLGPGEVRPLRLIVKGSPGLAFGVVARAPRAGAARLELHLE